MLTAKFIDTNITHSCCLQPLPCHILCWHCHGICYSKTRVVYILQVASRYL